MGARTNDARPNIVAVAETADGVMGTVSYDQTMTSGDNTCVIAIDAGTTGVRSRAVQIATDAIDRLHTTAESHDRVMVVEVMGRHAGWIATHAGIAGGATVVLIPEHPFDIDQVCQRLVRRHSRGRFASIVVVAEGAVPVEGSIEMADPEVDRFGHQRLGGIGNLVAAEIGRRTGFETRPVLLGHVQRGGTPTAFDRVLSTRFGVAAIDAVHDGAWGQMVALHGDDIVTVDLATAAGRSRPVDMSLFHDVAEIFFA